MKEVLYEGRKEGRKEGKKEGRKDYIKEGLDIEGRKDEILRNEGRKGY